MSDHTVIPLDAVLVAQLVWIPSNVRIYAAVINYLEELDMLTTVYRTLEDLPELLVLTSVDGKDHIYPDDTIELHTHGGRMYIRVFTSEGFLRRAR